MASNTLRNSETSRNVLKDNLRAALTTHDGDPRHPSVIEIIENLATLNPTPVPTQTSQLLDGNWQLISAPIFPDGKRLADGTYCYTLGRLAFNMFQPQDLTVVIQQVFQPVLPMEEPMQRTHDIVVDFVIAHPNNPSLRGTVRNLGICKPASDTVLQVQFTGGVLEPAADTDLQQWNAIFENSKAPTHSSIKDWVQSQLLKLMFGLVPPKEINKETGRIEFQMRRSPKGSLTILYLDEELRITRGQRETVLVCERR
ncbi:fimbrial protein [Pseudanabaena sp. FACHB-2040]|nr:fimbrial protein [Pseudanabaena sp. FACHB-2040]